MRSSEPAQVSQGTSHGVEPVREKGARGRQIGRTKGGMNTRLHAVADAEGRPIGFFMSPTRSAITPARRRCWAACQKRIGCWPTGAMMPIGSERR